MPMDEVTEHLEARLYSTLMDACEGRGLMDGWMGGLDGWMLGWMVDTCMDGWVDGMMDGCMAGWVEWIEVRMGE